MASGASFTIQGIEPSEVRAQPEAVRRTYWRWVVELVLDAKDRELAAGLDRFGDELTAIAERTRKYRRSDMGVADPDAPPLTPAYDLSRTRALFDGRAYADRAQFFWRSDAHTGASWGRILRYHADGAGDLPVRDVIGLSPDSLRWVRLQALARWRLYQRAQGVMQTAEDLAFQPATTPGPKQPPPTFAPTGITNLDHFTFGIGATKEEVQRAINEGYSTGFRFLPERTGPFRPGSTPKPAPAPSFGPSRATVTRQPDVPGTMDVASLVGATDEATVAAMRLGRISNYGIYVNAKGEGYESRVQVYPEHLEFSSLYVDADRQGKGLGTKILGRMIEAASQPDAGLKQITLWASRSREDVGYKVWPKLGFDAALPDEIRAALPDSLKDAKRISDLMITSEGVAWWATNGETISLSFDLAQGSLSRRIWDAYLKARASKAK